MKNKKHQSRTPCDECLRLNEARLETCYYCGTPIKRGWLKSKIKKVKMMFGTFGNKKA